MFRSMMWKIPAVQNEGDLQLIDKPRNLLRRTERILQGNQKHKETTIYRDQHILNESKMRRENLAMTLINNKMTYHMVP